VKKEYLPRVSILNHILANHASDMLDPDYSLFTIHYSLFTIHYSLFTFHFSLKKAILPDSLLYLIFEYLHYSPFLGGCVAVRFTIWRAGRFLPYEPALILPFFVFLSPFPIITGF
jgi:hypothetical protein